VILRQRLQLSVDRSQLTFEIVEDSLRILDLIL